MRYNPRLRRQLRGDVIFDGMDDRPTARDIHRRVARKALPHLRKTIHGNVGIGAGWVVVSRQAEALDPFGGPDLRDRSPVQRPEGPGGERL